MSRYRPRLTAPEVGDPLWVNVNYGGYNRCIVRNYETGMTLPNCTGYVHGRWMELAGSHDCPLSLGNADSYYGYGDGMPRGTEPALGAVLCFSGGMAGHVCVVEEIIDENTIRTSDSNYSSDYFTTYIRYRQYGWQWAGASLTYQGCIYNPYVKNNSLLLYMAARKKKRERRLAHGIKRTG